MSLFYGKYEFEQDVWPQYSYRFKNPATSKMYHRILNEMLSLTGKKDFLDITASDIVAYGAYLDRQVADGNLSDSSGTLHKYIIKAVCSAIPDYIKEYENPALFFTFRDFNDIITEIMPDEEVDRILECAKNMGDFYQAVILAVYCALTVAEICRLKGSYIKDNFLKVSSSGYSRVIRLPFGLSFPLRGPSEPLLCTKRGKPMTPRTLQRYLLDTDTAYTFTDLRTYGLVQMFACGIDENKLCSYTGLIKGFYRYRNAASALHVNPDISRYMHII